MNLEFKMTKQFIIIIFLIIYRGVSCIYAEPPAPIQAKTPVPHKITIKQIQDYLNGIKTFKAKIKQVNPNQQQLSGTVYINRTATKGDYGSLRIEYDQKDQSLVIADGKELILHNPHTKENTIYGIEQTPAAFLLQKNLNLEDDVTVKSFKEKNSKIEIVMTKFGAGDASVTLKFSTTPMLKFNGWVVVDPQGNRTDVNLNDVVIGIDLSPSLFIIEK